MISLSSVLRRACRLAPLGKRGWEAPRLAAQAGGGWRAYGTDEDIANANTMRPIADLARERFGMTYDDLESYGRFKAKVPFTYLDTLEENQNGKLILMTALSPTRFGEGKTCTSVGLADGLCQIGKVRPSPFNTPSFARAGCYLRARHVI